MKSRIDMKKKILILLMIVATLCLLTACSSGVDVDSIINEYPITVIIDYNGGKDGESEFQRIQCKMNSLLPIPGTTSFLSEPEFAGYEVGSYWKGTRDNNGEIVYEREWNFKTDRVTENITLFVTWQREKAINIVYGENNSQSYVFRIIESATSNNLFNRNDLETVAPKWQGHSFYAYYFDEDYNKELKYPYDYTENPVETLYAKYIEGDWKIIKSISDLSGIGANTNVWLDADIDLSTYRGNIFPVNYSGEFNGNGHKISNYTFSKSTSRGSANCYAGLINTLTSGAYIHDVALENFTLNVSFNEPNNDGATNAIGLLAAVVQEGARLQNVTISGTVNYDESASKRPVVCNGVYGTYNGENAFNETYPALTYQVIINK